MPKQTFLNIEDNKRTTFINAFLIAFTKTQYDDTSISLVLKENGFAKGSFYQYFENKLDLFNYLIKYSSETKFKYIHDIKRENFEDFWEYWRAIYKAGIQFDEDSPIQSNFLYQLSKNTESISLKAMFECQKKATLQYFEHLIEHEIGLGIFRDDLPKHLMANFILETSTQLFNYYQIKNAKIFDSHITQGLPLFYTEKCKTTFLEVLDQYIELMKSALNKKK
jgi:AcrR family transcriptional regulator